MSKESMVQSVSRIFGGSEPGKTGRVTAYSDEEQTKRLLAQHNNNPWTAYHAVEASRYAQPNAGHI